MRRPLLLLALAFFAAIPVSAQPAKKAKPVVVIDASRDGGAWWFPQHPNSEDPAKPHQGKALADWLKKRGWNVIELKRGAPPAPALAGAKVVVRIGHLVDEYTNDEVKAYKEFVVGGGTLVLVPGGAKTRGGKPGLDPVAAEFGFEFGEYIRTATCVWTSDPLVKGMNDARFIFGRKVSQTPSGAAPLAKVDADVVGSWVKVEKGRVFALGSPFILLSAHTSNRVWFEVPKK